MINNRYIIHFFDLKWLEIWLDGLFQNIVHAFLQQQLLYSGTIFSILEFLLEEVREAFLIPIKSCYNKGTCSTICLVDVDLVFEDV